VLKASRLRQKHHVFLSAILHFASSCSNDRYGKVALDDSHDGTWGITEYSKARLGRFCCGVFPRKRPPREDEGARTRPLAQNTTRGYQSDWKDFEAWCERQKRSALPADIDTLCLYFVICAPRLTKATLDRRTRGHRSAAQGRGLPEPHRRSEVSESRSIYQPVPTKNSMSAKKRMRYRSRGERATRLVDP
jgi:hypothetical protein